MCPLYVALPRLQCDSSLLWNVVLAINGFKNDTKKDTTGDEEWA